MLVKKLTTNLLSGLKDIDSELERLRYRSDHRDNIMVDTVSELGIRWEDTGPNYPRSGYYARIDGKDLPLTDGAMKTACRMIKTEPKYFTQFKDRSEFPRALIKGIDDGRRRNKGVLIRTNGLALTSVLPQDYKIHDAADILTDFVEPLRDNLGDIKGLQSLEQGDADICSYRIVMGSNIMPSLDEHHGQFMAFFFQTSESGLIPTVCTLGLYRAVCTNTAIREQAIVQWNHKTRFGPFYDKVAGVINKTGQYKSQYTEVFETLLSTPLIVPASDVLFSLNENRLITRAHYDLAVLYSGNQEVSTQWDLFNVLTSAARDMTTIQSRELAEGKVLKLFTEAGGLSEHLRRSDRW
jgi:hypothetical protein